MITMVNGDRLLDEELEAGDYCIDNVVDEESSF